MGAKKEVRTESDRMPLVSFRLPPEEYDSLQKVAAVSGESVSELVRNAVTIFVLQHGVGVVDVSSGNAEVTIQTPHVAGRKSGIVAPSFSNEKTEGQGKEIFQISADSR